MTRRRFVVTVSAVAILAMMLIVLGVAVGVTQTAYGRAWVRRVLVAQLTPAVKGGRLYVGNISGSMVTGATIDSLEIRDADDSVFVATGRVTVSWDPRDLLDRRVLLSAVRVEHPFVHIRKGEDGVWNYRRIFPSGAPKPPRTQPGFGDYIVVDTATVHRGAFFLTMPWHPADSLGGARRDSAIAYNLARRDAEIREVPAPRGAAPGAPRRFVKTWRWTRGEIASSHVRLADPDSAGRLIVLSKLSVAESDPPFRFSNVRGTVRILKDSAWLDIPHWDAPASTGSATGKVVWGSDLPTRYSIHVIGDSVSLNDVAWVYPTLPRTGGGRMVLDIRNQPGNLSVLEYAISRMDVRTTASRLTGQLTFGVGGPVLVVKDVTMQAAPLDFALIRTLNGKPFPYDWRGQITGSVRARGGPLNRFQVDQSDFVFRDANVPGAVTRGAGRGGLDILLPAFTAFRGFDVAVEQLDLRTIQFLNPAFPRLGGTVRGRAVLDSSWLDVRFRDADLTHRDGPDAPSRFTGSGRVTWGDEFMHYDLALQAQPLSLTTLARSYAMLPARGSYQGPLRVRGTIADLDLTTALTGPAGTMSVDGHFDLFPAGYAARGRGSVAGLDLRTLLPGIVAAPATSLSTQFEMDLAGDSLANLSGTLALDLERSRVEGVQLNGGRTRLRFDGGVVRADTIAVESEVATLAGAGALGLSRARRDSLRFTVGVGSLDALRRVLGAAEGDTLAGELTLRGVAAGSVDSLDVAGTVLGRGLYVAGVSAAELSGHFDLFGLPATAATGRAAVRLDSVRAGGRRLQYLAVEGAVDGPGRGRYAVEGAQANGARFAAGGNARLAGDTADVALDTLTVALGANVWRLERPSALRRSPFELAVDTMVLRGSAGGRVALGGVLPATAPVRFDVRADSVPLADLATLAQSGGTVDGVATLALTVTGTRQRPTMEAQAAVVDGRFGDVRVERLSATGRYADHRLETALGLRSRGEELVRANLSLPVDLALVPVARRLLDEPLRGTVRADSVNLGLLEAMTSAVQRASGNLRLLVDVGGRWGSPTFDGSVLVTDGAMTLPAIGIRLERVSADVALARDSVAIRRIAASTTGRKNGSIALRGSLGLADRENPSFDLTLNANYFHVVNKARVADLYVTTAGSQGLHLAGSVRRSRLTGGVFVPSGQIFIPELARKNVVSLDDPEFYQIVDTTLTTNRTLLPSAPPAVVRNLSIEDVRIAMGEDVWLRSSEANINLGGDVGVTVGRDERDRRDTSGVLFALSGQLLAERGTYRLDLGLALQRTFEVESGTLRFFGDPDLNPTLDISAIHTVRQANQSDRDIPIRVRIGGTLAQPTLTLSSADPNLQLSESDAISYLITGQPSFVIAGENQEYRSQAAGVILPSIGSYFGDKVANSLGLDVVQIETTGSAEGGAGGFFANTRLGGGVQIGSRTFIRANLGLCPFAQQLGYLSGNASASDKPLYTNVLTSIGAKLEYRLSDSYSASLGLDPPTREVLSCASRGATPSNFVTTPQQLGLDFTRKWDF